MIILIKDMRSKILAVALLCIFAVSALAGVSVELVDSVNQDANPDTENTWLAADVGWEYTPTINYTLTSIFTKFSYIPYGDNRTVTVEVYDRVPSNGGRLLRSADFIPQAGTFSGASFPPINLLAGHTYFIGFRNVSELGVNGTGNPEATVLSAIYFSYVDDGSYSFSELGDGSPCRPVLEFYGRARRHDGAHH